MKKLLLTALAFTVLVTNTFADETNRFTITKGSGVDTVKLEYIDGSEIQKRSVAYISNNFEDQNKLTDENEVTYTVVHNDRKGDDYIGAFWKYRLKENNAFEAKERPDYATDQFNFIFSTKMTINGSLVKGEVMFAQRHSGWKRNPWLLANNNPNSEPHSDEYVYHAGFVETEDGKQYWVTPKKEASATFIFSKKD